MCPPMDVFPDGAGFDSSSFFAPPPPSPNFPSSARLCLDSSHSAIAAAGFGAVCPSAGLPCWMFSAAAACCGLSEVCAMSCAVKSALYGWPVIGEMVFANSAFPSCRIMEQRIAHCFPFSKTSSQFRFVSAITSCADSSPARTI